MDEKFVAFFLQEMASLDDVFKVELWNRFCRNSSFPVP